MYTYIFVHLIQKLISSRGQGSKDIAGFFWYGEQVIQNFKWRFKDFQLQPFIIDMFVKKEYFPNNIWKLILVK